MRHEFLTLKIRVSIVLIFCLTFISLPIIFKKPVAAQTTCNQAFVPIPDNVGSIMFWPYNSEVTVHIRSGTGQFSQDDYDCINTVFDNYNNANSTTYSGNKNYSKIHFTVSFSSTVVATVQGNGSRNEPGITRGFQVDRGNDTPSAGTYGGNDGTNRTSAVTKINSAVVSCTALKFSIAHEIGHTMGLNHYCGQEGTAPCPQTYEAIGQSVMNNVPAPNDSEYGRETPADCDNAVIACKVADKCPNTRDLSISGSFPQIVGYSSQITYHQMTIANYNDSTGTFEVKFTDYNTNKSSPSATPTYTSASIPTHAVVKNSDPCIHVNGQVINVTPAFTTPPTFNCALTKTISLAWNRTENVTPPGSGSSYPFINVYNGQTTPGTGAPYMHFIPYSAVNNQYVYAYNVYH